MNKQYLVLNWGHTHCYLYTTYRLIAESWEGIMFLGQHLKPGWKGRFDWLFFLDMDEWRPNREPSVEYAEVLSVVFHFVSASPVKVSEITAGIDGFCTMLEGRVNIGTIYIHHSYTLKFRRVHSVNMQVERTYPSLLWPSTACTQKISPFVLTEARK